MLMYNKSEIANIANEYGFQRDTFEKVLRLKTVLEFIQEDTLLRDHLVLKGGTSINLTVFALPRLSVDIDMDYIPNDSREDMLETRNKISDLLKDYMESEGYRLLPDSRFSHSLDAFHFQYLNSGGNRDMLKIELNYSLRSHIFEPVYQDILTSAFGENVRIRTVHPIEVFAAKSNALLSRAAARDLYDFNNLIDKELFSEPADHDMFRKSVVYYATISADKVNRTFDTSAIDTLTFAKIRRDLFPVLTRQEARQHFNLDTYKEKAKAYLRELMVLLPQEEEYMDLFIQGEYKPELLFTDIDIQKRLKDHPMAIWKCIMNKG